jgi:hypothetical protein
VGIAGVAGAFIAGRLASAGAQVSPGVNQSGPFVPSFLALCDIGP